MGLARIPMSLEPASIEAVRIFYFVDGATPITKILQLHRVLWVEFGDCFEFKRIRSCYVLKSKRVHTGRFSFDVNPLNFYEITLFTKLTEPQESSQCPDAKVSVVTSAFY